MESSQQFQDRKEREHWRFDKHINVSHLIATVSLAVGIFAWGNAMDKRVVILETRTEAQKDVDRTQDKALEAAATSLEKQLNLIWSSVNEGNRKLDRLIERGGK